MRIKLYEIISSEAETMRNNGVKDGKRDSVRQTILNFEQIVSN